MSKPPARQDNRYESARIPTTHPKLMRRASHSHLPQRPVGSIPDDPSQAFGESGATSATFLSGGAGAGVLGAEAEQRYKWVAENVSAHWHPPARINRSPYTQGQPMCRGADFFPAFQHYIAAGGVARFKNTAVMSLRINNVFALDVLNGSFHAAYFLDVAFWVPAFDRDFYEDPNTVGMFARFEPQMTFPDALENEFLGRVVEFSKDKNSRRHEIQLGQNVEWRVKLNPTAVVASAVTATATPRATTHTPPPPAESHASLPAARQSRTSMAALFDDVEGSELDGEGGAGGRKGKSPPPRSPSKAPRVRPSTGRHNSHLSHLNAKFAGAGGVAVLRASDRNAHWPRLWRTLVSDEDVDAILDESSSNKKRASSSGSSAVLATSKSSAHSSGAKKGQGGGSKRTSKERVLTGDDEAEEEDDGFGREDDADSDPTTRIRRQLRALDKQRAEVDLAHPDEGIVFITHELEATCMEHFELEDFPYDTQALSIKIRMDKSLEDPLYRYIVPLCSDKAFFCSSRVAPLVEWSINLNCHWEVEAGSGGDIKRDGGRQRMVCQVLVQRKSFFYTLHYIVIAFSITTIVFCAFTVRPEEVESRSSIVLTVLLTVVAFNYVCQDKIPNVPYATVLDTFLIANHVMILWVGIAVMFFAFVNAYPDVWLCRQIGGYNGTLESFIGGLMFFIWMFGNAFFWAHKHRRVMKVREVMEFDERLGIMNFSAHQINSSERHVVHRHSRSHVGTFKNRTFSLWRWGSGAKARRRKLFRAQMKKLEEASLVAVGGDGEAFFYDR